MNKTMSFGVSQARLPSPSFLLLVALCAAMLSVAGLAQCAPIGGLRETKSLIGSLVNVVAALSVVILLLYAFVYLLKKSGINQGSSAHSKIKVLETKMIAPKKYIAIVEVAGKILTVGITDNNINLLTELDGENAADLQYPPLPGSSSKITGKFGAILNKVRGKESSGRELL